MTSTVTAADADAIVSEIAAGAPVYRAEFAVDGAWYTNAVRFDDPQEACDAAHARYAVWTMSASWRVVDDRTPGKQPYVKDDPTDRRASGPDGQPVG